MHRAVTTGIGGLSPDRQRQGDFFLCDVFDAIPKDDLASMEHPLFSLATRPDRRILSYAHNGVEITVTPSVKGLATIHDKDILIFCISQLMSAINAGRDVSRTLHLKAHDLLLATNRETSGDAYRRLREAFERLAGTRITTNIVTGETEVTSGFGLIERWEIVRKTRGGRMADVWRASRSRCRTGSIVRFCRNQCSRSAAITSGSGNRWSGGSMSWRANIAAARRSGWCRWTRC